MDGNCLDFQDNSYDSVLLFEVLERLHDADGILEGVKRVAKKNILMTVPNCTSFYEIKNLCLTFEHMLEKNYKHFFTKQELENLFIKHFRIFKVEEREPILPGRIGFPSWLQYLQFFLFKLKLVQTKINFRFYAVAEVE
jgi:ubiquinone/menaquinone biosynthesis C-methylase UbiE